MHTDPTLDIFSLVTTSLGNTIRTFKEKTCVVFPTRELEREWDARTRRQEKSTNTVPGAPGSRTKERGHGARASKELNLERYTYHALGDYVDTIRRVGTTDSYSTQPVSVSSFLILLLNIKACTRMNVNIEHQKHGSCGPAADLSHNNYPPLNDDNVVSV
jgi:hypothetical protein